jgi:hypothetical protein
VWGARERPRFDGALESLDLVARLSGHLGVIQRQELARLRELFVHLFQTGRALDDLREALMLPTKRRHPLGVTHGAGIE